MLVRERMSRNPNTISADAPMEEALKRMRENSFRHLPVVDKSGQLVGIVSETDLLYASPTSAASLSIYEMQYLLSRLTVGQVMTTNVCQVPPDANMADVYRRLAQGGCNVVLVRENDRIIGLVTPESFRDHLVGASGG